MTVDPEPTPHELGIQFARTCLDDPSTPTTGLDEHHLSHAYRSCHDTLLFLCGRQAGRDLLDDDETYLFLKGFLAGLRPREDDPN